jgi:hypothetical protein
MKSVISCLFLVACWSHGQAVASIQEQLSEEPALEYRAPYEVVKLFLKAVDRGELVVFGLTLDRAVLTPKRVEYVYELDSLNASVKIYSELTQPLSVPDLQQVKVYGVSAIMDSEGNITEVSAFVQAD